MRDLGRCGIMVEQDLADWSDHVTLETPVT